MSEEVLVVVKIPIQPLAEDVRSRNNLDEELFDVKLEEDNIVLFFKRPLHSQTAQVEMITTAPTSAASVARFATTPKIKNVSRPESSGKTRRRRRSARNRMKTRGWQVVAKIVNSKGQTAIVYKPFVDGLFGKQLTPAQQRLVVGEILRSNGNDPTEASIEYFLTNTLEYLMQVNKPEIGA